MPDCVQFIKHLFVIVNVLSSLFSCCCATFALCQVPDYRDLIKNPMDFATMRRKVDLQAYRTVDDIAADFQLMIRNCMTYNAKNTIFYRAAVKLMKQVVLVLHVLRMKLLITHDNGTILDLTLLHSKHPERNH